MNKKMGNQPSKTLVLSDVSLGRGVPQLMFLIESLANNGATVRVVEPDMKGAPEVNVESVEICREITFMPPNHPSFAVDYLRACREHIETYMPDVVVMTSGFMVMALLTAKNRPSTVVYYAFEDKAHQIGIAPYSSAMLCELLAEESDAVLVPEANRADLDYPRAVRSGKVSVVLNTSPKRNLPAISEQRFDETGYLSANPDVAASVARGAFRNGYEHYLSHGHQEGRPTGTRSKENCRFLLAGTLDRRSLLEVFADPSLTGIQADIFGVLGGAEAESIMDKVLRQHKGVKFHGVISNAELRRIGPNYDYRVVFWNDSGINELFACPNKLFEAISDGVPVVGTPQPQIFDVLSTWGCGVLARDWSVGAASEAIRVAMQIYETEAYDELRLNARAAHEHLNWETEFFKISDRFSRRAIADSALKKAAPNPRARAR